MSRYGWGGDTWQDNNGKPLSRGKLYFYETDTSTAKVTYSDEAMTVANPAYVTLDAAGRQPDIFFAGAARLVIQSAAGVQIDDVDPVYPVGGAGPVYSTVAAMVADPGILLGSYVETVGYYAAGD